jgi:prepilin-type N-terminal cleavage/methylation domain-containing protein
MNSCRGVTLIELIVVLVIISIGLAGVAQTYSFIWKSGVTAAENDLQTASNLAQSCALAILGKKKSSDANNPFANFKDVTCSQATSICAPNVTPPACKANLSDPSGYSLETTKLYIPVAPPDAPSNTDRSGCPSQLECLKITITVRGSSANSTSDLSLLVANYE